MAEFSVDCDTSPPVASIDFPVLEHSSLEFVLQLRQGATWEKAECSYVRNL